MTNKEVTKILNRAISEDNMEMVLFTWENNPGFDPSFDRNWLLRASAGKGWTTLVARLLADPRVDPTAEDNEAIRWAASNGRLEVVKLLLNDSRVDPTEGDNFAIKWANQNGYVEVVELLEKHGCKIPRG